MTERLQIGIRSKGQRFGFADNLTIGNNEIKYFHLKSGDVLSTHDNMVVFGQ
jgi:hypothetical protein